jgi:hypothetical protein
MLSWRGAQLKHRDNFTFVREPENSTPLMPNPFIRHDPESFPSTTKPPKIHLSIVFTSPSWSYKWTFSNNCPHKNSQCTSFIILRVLGDLFKSQSSSCKYPKMLTCFVLVSPNTFLSIFFWSICDFMVLPQIKRQGFLLVKSTDNFFSNWIIISFSIIYSPSNFIMNIISTC